MQVTNLTEWLSSPETQALRAYLHQQRMAAVKLYLAGQVQADPLSQGKAAGVNHIAELLALPPDKLKKLFEELPTPGDK